MIVVPMECSRYEIKERVLVGCGISKLLKKDLQFSQEFSQLFLTF